MANIKNIGRYARATLKALRLRPSFSTLIFSVRHASECLRLFEGGAPDFLTSARPWMCFPAVIWLDRVLKPDARVFEYGSGGSTLYFARTARKVVSIEHEPAWYLRVRAELEARRLHHVHYQLIEPELNPNFDRSRIADALAYTSADEKTAGYSFVAYARSIEAYPDGYFDLVVVDGRARPSCLMHAMKKVGVGGILLLDQSERSYYLAGLPALHDRNRWKVVRFMAPLPYSLHFTEATFFTKTRP